MTMQLSIRLEGLTELQRRTADPRILADAERRFLLQSGLAVQRGAQIGAPVDQGRLRGSIKVEVDPSPSPQWAKVGTNVFYAPYQEYGTGIYGPKRRRIRPKQAQALRWAVGGGFAFARSVAGTPGKRYMEKGLRGAESRIASLRRKLASDIAKGISRGR